jgi:hypothetical protein
MGDLELRKVEALEGIGTALRNMAASMHLNYLLERDRFMKEYPLKGEVKDATITRRQTEEEKLREEQGDTDESDADWTGQRERAYTEAKPGRRRR